MPPAGLGVPHRERGFGGQCASRRQLEAARHVNGCSLHAAVIGRLKALPSGRAMRDRSILPRFSVEDVVA